MPIEPDAEFVSRLEQEAETHPNRHQIRALLLAALGYGYLFGLLALLLLVISLLIILLAFGEMRGLTVQLAVLLGVLAYLLGRSLWVPFPLPEGIPLQKEQAASLFHELEQLGKRLKKAPRFHSILLTGDFNASVIQIPRLGMFGWHNNYLVIGLPYLLALSPAQFRSILAHELGHLSGEHSSFGGWIYRIRRSWFQLMQNLAREKHWGTFLVKRFLNWYIPVFDAYSLVLRRANEYEADLTSAKLTDSETLAEALVRSRLIGTYLESRFWPSVMQRLESQSEPPAGVYTRMRESLQSALEPEIAQQWLESSLSQTTDDTDSHPSLANRIMALGVTPRLPQPLTASAAEHFLNDSLEELLTQMNRSWREANIDSWHD